MPLSITSEMTLGAAIDAWLPIKGLYISPRTQKDYRQYATALLKHFKREKGLASFNIEDFRSYQIVRSRDAGPGKVNDELNLLRQILVEADLWDGALARKYRRLRGRTKSPGKALSPDEINHLLMVAGTRPRWHLCRLLVILFLNTTVHESELKGLQAEDLHLKERYITVYRGTKNVHRQRKIELNDSALWAVKELLKRAEEKKGGPLDPKDLLLPHRAHLRGQPPDFSKSIYGIRKAWINLRMAAGMPTLRFYDLRHTAISRLAASKDVSQGTIAEIAGHSSVQMQRRYSHITTSARMQAFSAIDSGIGVPSFKAPKPEPKRTEPQQNQPAAALNNADIGEVLQQLGVLLKKAASGGKGE